MKILTNKQYETLIKSVKKDAYNEGQMEGYNRGYKQGLHDGLTRDKNGVHYTSNGIYVFDDGVSTELEIGCKRVK